MSSCRFPRLALGVESSLACAVRPPWAMRILLGTAMLAALATPIACGTGGKGSASTGTSGSGDPMSCTSAGVEFPDGPGCPCCTGGCHEAPDSPKGGIIMMKCDLSSTGGPCGSNVDCRSGNCVGGKCGCSGYGAFTASCLQGSEADCCFGLSCPPPGAPQPNSQCEASAPGHACDENSDCTSNFCGGGVCACAAVPPPCSSNADCTPSGIDSPGACSGDGLCRCTPGCCRQDGQMCTKNEQCDSSHFAGGCCKGVCCAGDCYDGGCCSAQQPKYCGPQAGCCRQDQGCGADSCL